METENKKIGFFSRVKIAITKLEDYSIFTQEKMSIAIKYFFLIVLIMTIVLSALETHNTMKIVNKAYNYIKNEAPNFAYSNDEMNITEKVKAYDNEYDIYLIADTSDEVTDEILNNYKNEIKTNGFIFLKNKIIYINSNIESEYVYKDIVTQNNIEDFDKNKIINDIENVGMIGISIMMFIIIGIGIYVFQIISIFMDWIVITIFTYICSKICRVNMTLNQSFNMSIYALTLSIILSIIYDIAYYLAGFYIENFRLVYLLIAYIYVVAAIMMMKSDLMNQTVKVTETVEIKKDDDNKEENPDNEKNKKTPDKKDENEELNDENMNNEPDGSEI